MKRSSYLKYDETVELGKRGLTIWAYGRTGRYVCRGNKCCRHKSLEWKDRGKMSG